MPYYHRLGRIPPKRHTVFRRDSGELLHEELMGNESFQGAASLLYHLNPPTRMREIGSLRPTPWTAGEAGAYRPRHLRTSAIPAGGDLVTGRRPLLYNEDVALEYARPTRDAAGFYRNGQGDELLFVSDGGGVLESAFGDLPFRRGDYLIVPRGIVHRFRLAPGEQRFLVVESAAPVRTPARYRNDRGQHCEWSPYCERDFRLPSWREPVEERGEFEVLVKQRAGLVRFVYDRHPFDVVGWDGYYYPWAIHVGDFEPIVGRIHQPPPVHQVFESRGFVVCNFVPRLFDFHPQAVAVPYHHSNVGADEVLYYASERFMSRKGIEYGSITLHPDGIPHGPHPGTIEASLGARETDELAVMVDSFRPLIVSRAAEEIEDPDYPRSWLGGESA
jgi:homogentisate 1,2-dioxygenase